MPRLATPSPATPRLAPPSRAAPRDAVASDNALFPVRYLLFPALALPCHAQPSPAAPRPTRPSRARLRNSKNHRTPLTEALWFLAYPRKTRRQAREAYCYWCLIPHAVTRLPHTGGLGRWQAAPPSRWLYVFFPSFERSEALIRAFRTSSLVRCAGFCLEFSRNGGFFLSIYGNPLVFTLAYNYRGKKKDNFLKPGFGACWRINRCRQLRLSPGLGLVVNQTDRAVWLLLQKME